MNKTQFRQAVNDLVFQASMSMRYCSTLGWRFDAADRAIRVAVGLVAAIGVVWSGTIWINLTALVLAIALNIIPTGTFARFYSDLLRRWSDIRLNGESVLLQAEAHKGPNVPQWMMDRLRNLLETKVCVLAVEPAPWGSLLKRCYGDQIEALYGPGIRTVEAAQKKRQSRK